MPRTPEKPGNEFRLFHLLPNMVTIAAICAGMTSIRFGIQGNYELSAQLILAASVLDGVDGRLARLLKSKSKLGAELDSLADFANFGVAPALVIYFWALQDLPRAGWIAVLVFAVCTVIRLARFNVSNGEDSTGSSDRNFTGVPAPAGALLALLPMYLSFAFSDAALVHEGLVSIYLIGVGMLMISRVPTFSPKSITISRQNVRYFLVGFAFLGAAVLSFPWETLLGLCLIYLGTVFWAMFSGRAIGQPREA